MIIRNFIFSSLIGSISLLSYANASSIDENSGLPKGQKKVTIAQQDEELKKSPHKDGRVQRVLEDKSTVRTKSVVEKELEIVEKQEKVAREEYSAFSTKMFKESQEQKAKAASTKLQASSKIKMAEWQEKSAALIKLQAERSLVLAAENENVARQALNPKKQRFVHALTAFRHAGVINPTVEEIKDWLVLATPAFSQTGILNPTTEEINAWIVDVEETSWKKKHSKLTELETEFQEKKAAWEKKKEELEKLMEEKRKSSFFSKFIDILNKVWGLIKF